MINKIFDWVSNYKNSIISKIKFENRANNLVLNDSLKENIKLILYTSFFEMILHIGVILLFVYNILTQTIVNYTWQISIIVCHSIFLLVSFVVYIITIKIYHHVIKNILIIKVIQTIYFLSLLTMGVILAGVDQIVGHDIMPFIIASLSVGGFFIIRPRSSFILYTIAYATFVIMMEQIIPGNAKLITYLANGFAMVIIGYTVSLIGWHNHRTNINQRNEIARQQEILEKMAYFDALTNVPNRRYFDTIIEKEKAKIKRKKSTSSLAILDIDHFKKINDSYGHSIGDTVLRELAKIITFNIRKTDTFARLGGEEFIMLFPDTSVDDSYKIVNKLREAIMKKKIIVGSKVINITASFGVSKLSENDDINYYADADKALYEAKNSGRNKVVKHKK